IAILDADKEGFLRSDTSLIQIIGRAARNSNGRVILYADKVTDSMTRAISETYRRRGIQDAYNREHHITPTTISKAIKDSLIITKEDTSSYEVDLSKLQSMSHMEKKRIITKLEKEMADAAKKLDFEEAMSLRDIIFELKAS
ncbi:MAG: UvrB/UvrC motif-containing protein, partial [Bacilli bacterium]